MPAPQRITDRMLLAMRDAFSAAHYTHEQVRNAVRDWSESVGKRDLEAQYRAETEKGSTHNG